MWHTPKMQDVFQRMTYMQSTDAQPTTSCDTLTRHLLRLQSPYARAYIHRNSHSCCHLSSPIRVGAMPCSIPASRRLFPTTPGLGRTPTTGGATPVKWHEKTTYARMRCASLFLNHTHKWKSTNTFNYLRIYSMIYDTAVESLRHRGGVITLPR